MRHLALAAALFLAACNSPQTSSETPARSTATALAVTPAPVAAAPAAPATSRSAELTLVTAPSQVCMVNDQFMGREQIPVEVGGKTYFGCCEMCKGRLASDATARVGKDPVSGKAVDKSSAVIGKRPNGEVVYFESAANFESYRRL